MAKFRSQGMRVDPKEEAGLVELMKDEHKRGMLLLPREALQRQVLRDSPKLDEKAVEALLDGFDMLREQDPLAVLQKGSLEGGEGGGQLIPYKMAPNFEITMYLAQATGSCIVTDSVFRWRELTAAAGRGIQGASPFVRLRASMESAKFVFPNDVQEIGALADRGIFRSYPAIMGRAFNYLSQLRRGARSPISKPASVLNSSASRPPPRPSQRSQPLSDRKRGSRVFGPLVAFKTTPLIGSS
jgi:hypothetical protein